MVTNLEGCRFVPLIGSRDIARDGAVEREARFP